MINESIEDMILYNDDELMIEASHCATVREENTLLHALMLLSTVGYSSIPVLSSEQKLVGVINMPLIVEGVKDSLEYNWDLLSKRKVGELMCRKAGTVFKGADLEDILHELVDHNYVCVVDRSGHFRGIITRKEILKRVNFMAHEIDQFYSLTARERVLSLIS